MEAGGDVLKFAGDALLAFWNCSRFEASGMLTYVLQESLMMQNDFDNFNTSDGVILRMKLGLSVGKMDIHYIGNDKYKTFDVTGEAIEDVKKAQSLAKSGTVVISKAAWEMCNKQRCFAKLVGPGFAQVNADCVRLAICVCCSCGIWKFRSARCYQNPLKMNKGKTPCLL